MESFLESTKHSVVEVMHHSGYQPDIFSMDEDYDYTFFYGNGGQNTYAPAFMMNRTNLDGTVPVMNVSLPYLQAAADYAAANSQPYVTLDLKSSYIPETREVGVKLKVKGFNDLPSAKSVFNVVLIQDGMVAWQSNGGDNYVHNAVFRGTLTGSSFGKLMPDGFKGGSTTEWETTYTLPEAIRSSFWTDALLAQADKTADEVTLPTDSDNMYLVAYVGSYDDTNVNGHQVYNCVKVKLGESHEQTGTTGIEDATMTYTVPSVRVVDGKIVIDGQYDRATVYDLSGKKVSAQRSLASGLYIVRVEAGGHVSAKKVMVK